MILKSYQSKNRGFTLLDLIIGLIIMTIIIIIALHNLLESPESQQIRKPAERNLRAFAHGNQLNALKCQGKDEDGDGWVLCEANDRKQQTVKLQCGYDHRHSDCYLIPKSV
ncbi:hypothetical protein PCC8801_3416 [Rippkaea orientalis PCC 8801]|uniref:Prepilin-type N-terminal cleavage/methylation domain-containing protein n=1 Tax=Rippkaea orientalis (strain PCC 8801 / RF-1) TaxID=41431 RepID=B7K0A0_RIPO1|nr:prepilin-type N-terminal cleavage/methylation domain-containing protein [Rippkaea orientalis]ACK67384.1 hypothetical protein PCC8801_3416 [Rippkaea orientalis PCC 8801]